MELPVKCEMSSDDADSFSNPRVLLGVVHTLVPDADKDAKNNIVSHFDCGAITENTLYALNQVQQRHITPEELEISRTEIFFTMSNSKKN